jgi:hypothetical protein
VWVVQRLNACRSVWAEDMPFLKVLVMIQDSHGENNLWDFEAVHGGEPIQRAGSPSPFSKKLLLGSLAEVRISECYSPCGSNSYSSALQASCHSCAPACL